jgi:hypothetical protein
MADITPAPDPNKPLPSADEAFGKALPTAEDAFGKDTEGLPTPFDITHGTTPADYKGTFADYYFTHKTSLGRIMSAFGQGTQQDWGASGSHIDQDLKDYASKSPALQGFLDSHKELAKGVNETFIRPWAHILDNAINAGSEVMQGVQAGTEQTAEELSEKGASLAEQDPNSPSWGVSNVLGKAAGYGLSALGEVTSGVAQGFIPEVHGLGGIPHLQDAPRIAQEARAHGAIGEGEQGFFNTREVSPEDLEARKQAALDAGIPPPPPPGPPVFDINQLAREIDPDTFSKLDSLRDLQENLRLSRDQQLTIAETSEDYKTAKAASDYADAVPDKLRELDAKIQELLPDAADVRAQVNEWLDSPGEHGDMYRDYVQAKMLEAQMAIDGIEPSVKVAQDHAKSLLPSEKEISETLEKNNPKAAPGLAEDQSLGSGTGSGTGTRTSEVSNPQTTNTRISGLAQDISDRFEKETGKKIEDLPEIDRVNIKNEAKTVEDTINSDYDQAKRIAFGSEEPPAGTKAMSFFVGVEKKALADGDYETGRRLAQSPLAVRGSEAGQTLRILAERDPTNPLDAIKIIEDARANKVLKGRGLAGKVLELAKELEPYMDKSASGLDEWIKAAQDIQC